MRVTIAAVLLLLPCSSFAHPVDAPADALAQGQPCVTVASSVMQFDPYKPSHLAIMRNYGGTLLAQAPLGELLKLDPYVPSQAALLRQVGGAIPLWAFPAYSPYLVPAPYPVVQHDTPCEPMREEPPAPTLTTVNELLAVLEQRRVSATATTGQASSAQTPARSSGITIVHAGRTWTSAGHAVPFSEAEFIGVGERTGSPVFRRRGGDATVIYVPTVPGMVAPFRAVK